MLSKNSFIKGLNQDISKTKYQNTNYIDAKNLRLVTDSGLSSGSLINVKGNDLFITTPSSSPVFNLLPVAGFGNSASSLFTFNINGNIQTATGPETLAFITSSLNTLYTNIKAFELDTSVLVYSPSGLNITTFIITGPFFIAITPIVPYITNHIPIGWVNLRDDLYLFTTDNTTQNPGGLDPNFPTNPISAGQIWKLTYNKVTFTPTITLIYNNLINFTTKHPIPTTAVEGRYESQGIQKLFWTDNYNKLRILNVADPNAFAVDPTLLDAQPQISFSVPKLDKVNDSGGVLEGGVYNCAYRLKNTGGAVTKFSELSNNVSLTSEPSSTAFRDYVGSVGVTTKSITWDIDNLDTDFDRIEIASIYRSASNIQTIQIFNEQPIPAGGKITVTLTGNETSTIPISLDEFLNLNVTFDVCKTLASKDNTMFVGNVKIRPFDLDYDARAYSFDSTQQAQLISVSGQPTITLSNNPGPPAWNSVPENHDAVNPSPDTVYKFQADGATSGGEGPNIKYTFKQISEIGDAVNGILQQSLSNPYGLNNRFTNPNPITYTVNGEAYDNNNFYTTYKSPYIDGLLRGYMHNETYRFGIVFFDLQGRPGFVKWIADIRMPYQFQSPATVQNPNTLHTGIRSGGEQDTRILVPEFTVNIPTTMLKSISAFSIVRVNRTQADKSILGAGVVFPALSVSGSAFAKFFVPVQASNTQSGTIGGNPYFISSHMQTFQCADFIFEGFPGFATGDKLIVDGILQAPSATHNKNVAAFRLIKYYNILPSTQLQEILIVGATEVARGDATNDQVITLQNFPSDTFINRTIDGGGANDDTLSEAASVGSQTVLLRLANNLNYQSDGLISATRQFDKYYAYYKRSINTPTSSTQYGGNSFIKRSNNVYMQCGHFQTLTPSSSTNFTVQLFGGDIFNTIFDNQKLIKTWPNSPANGKFSTTCWMPIESTANVDLRIDAHVNRIGLDDTGFGLNLGENYSHVHMFDLFNDTKQYFPKPDPFVENLEFDNRFYFSGIKINGELTDSWTLFKTNDFWDVDGTYGPINAMLILQDAMLFWQDKSIGVLSINPRSLIQDITGTELQLGSGNKIQRHDYLSADIGCKHQHGIIKSPYSAYWFDIINRKFYKFTKGGPIEPLSDLEGLHSFFKNNLTGSIQTTDNPVDSFGITAGYDYKYNEVTFTFLDSKPKSLFGVLGTDTKFTLIYSEPAQSFTSFIDVFPSMYITDKNIILTPNPSNKNQLWRNDIGDYGRFYGTYFKSYIRMLINPNPEFTKLFDNLIIQTEIQKNGVDTASPPTPVQETFNQLRVFNDYQDSGTITLTPGVNTKRRERTWHIAVPKDQSPGASTIYNPRMRDKYLQIELFFTNNANKRLVFHDFITSYRPSIT